MVSRIPPRYFLKRAVSSSSVQSGSTKGSIDAHLLNRMGIEFICTAIKGRRAHDMIASLHDIHNGHRDAACQMKSAWQRLRFRSQIFAATASFGRILEPRIEISALLQVEQSSHLVAGIVFDCRALVNRAAPSARRFPAGSGLDAFCLNLIIAHLFPPVNFKVDIWSADGAPYVHIQFLHSSFFPDSAKWMHGAR